MLQTLPTELALKAFKHLNVQQLANLQLVSSYWKSFFNINEDSIYRNAAALHGLVSSPTVSLSDAMSPYPQRSMVYVESWKEFCKRRFQIEASWIGRGPSAIKEYKTPGKSVYSFVIDEEEGYIIVTSDDGGMLVVDISQDRVLWSLSKEYVARNAQCEHNRGFLIFNRANGHIEVWRQARDFITVDLQCDPDQTQLDASAEALGLHASSSLRGHFRPWALLEIPDLKTFCLAYPTLLAASQQQAFLWDIPTAQLSLTITFGGNVNSLGGISHVHISSTLIFVSFENRMIVFSRESGVQLFVLDPPRIGCTHRKIELRPTDWWAPADMQDAVLIPRATYNKEDGVLAINSRLEDLRRNFHPRFRAVETSGADLVILLQHPKILVVRNFESVIHGYITLSDAALEIDFFYLSGTIPSTHEMAFRNGKVALTTDTGIFVITLNGLDGMGTSGSIQTPPHSLFPQVSICCASRLNAYFPLMYLSCLRLSDTGIFIPWNLDAQSGPPGFSQSERPLSGLLNLEQRVNDMALMNAPPLNLPITVGGNVSEPVDLDESESDSESDSDHDSNFGLPRPVKALVCIDLMPPVNRLSQEMY